MPHGFGLNLQFESSISLILRQISCQKKHQQPNNKQGCGALLLVPLTLRQVLGQGGTPSIRFLEIADQLLVPFAQMIQREPHLPAVQFKLYHSTYISTPV